MKALITFLLICFVARAQDLTQSANMVINAFNNDNIKNNHVTPYLLEIARNGHQLDSNIKAKLEELGFNFNQSLVSRGGAKRSESIGLDKFYDSGNFRIHYTTIGRNAVSGADNNANNIPDYIENVSNILNFVAQKIRDEMGFFFPLGMDTTQMNMIMEGQIILISMFDNYLQIIMAILNLNNMLKAMEIMKILLK